ncbi:MAG: hypothetical protein WKF66_21325 [Pedobacter sp.]
MKGQQDEWPRVPRPKGTTTANGAFKQLGPDVGAMGDRPMLSSSLAGHHGLSDRINNEIFVINLASAPADVTQMPQLLKCFNVCVLNRFQTGT